jgi:HPt (histidine-containing phosphotransfer) domain-containing protein
MDAYLTKPIDMRELRAVLHECRPLAVKDVPVENTSPAAGDIVAVVDLAALRGLEGILDKEQIIETIQLFLKESPALLAAIGKAIERRDATAIKSPAHTLKGTSLSLGAAGLSAHCAALEALGKAGDFPGAARKLAEARAEFETVQGILKSEIKRLGEPNFVPVGRV